MKVSVIIHIYLLVVELLILYFIHNQHSTRGTEGGGGITLWKKYQYLKIEPSGQLTFI